MVEGLDERRPNAEAQNNVAEAQHQQQQPGFMAMVFQMLVMLFIFNLFTSGGRLAFKPVIPEQKGNVTGITEGAVNVANVVVDPQARKPMGAVDGNTRMHNLLWPHGSKMKLDVYISESTTPPSLSSSANNRKTNSNQNILAHWEEINLILSDKYREANTRNTTVTIPISNDMMNNRTQLYAHVYLTRMHVASSSTSDKRKQGIDSHYHDKMNQLYKRVNISKYKLRKKLIRQRSLLEGQDDNNTILSELYLDPSDKSVLGLAAREMYQDVTLMYVKPALALQLVDDIPSYFRRGSIPPQMSKLMDFYTRPDDDIVKDSIASSKNGDEIEGVFASFYDGAYYPILHPSEFWLRHEDTFPVNATLKEVTINLSICPAKVSFPD